MSKSLYTPIVDLSYAERIELIQFVKKWCAACFGVNNRHSKRLSVRCIEPDYDDYDNMYFGWYDQLNNRIYINLNHSKHVKQFLKTFLHEYTHSMQPVKSRYALYNKAFGYQNNPHEVAARANEVFYKHVWHAFKAQPGKS